MILDQASEWRKGREGYARKRRHVGFSSIEEWRLFLHAELSRQDEAAQRRKIRSGRHGRAGALYCGGDK